METIKQQEKATNGKMKSKERSYYAKVAVVGPSGTGKSYLSITADREKTAYINVENQPLPYKGKPFKFEGRPKTWTAFNKCLKDYAENLEIENIIIDSQTEAFNILNAEANKNFSGWDRQTYYNEEVYKYLVYLKSINKDIITLSHDELVKIGDSGKQKRMVVHNKQHEGKVEHHYTIVLYSGSRVENEKPTWFLKTFEEDTSAKTPPSMFPDKNGDNLREIPNDAKYIFDSIAEYYSL